MTELGLRFDATSAATACGVIAAPAAMAPARLMNSRRVDCSKKKVWFAGLFLVKLKCYPDKINRNDSSSCRWLSD
jgi:hypothetical protein